jgi:hypothetical protein
MLVTSRPVVKQTALNQAFAAQILAVRFKRPANSRA